MQEQKVCTVFGSKSALKKQRIASQQSRESIANKMPLVDKHGRHDRIRMVSIGLYDNEKLVGQPCQIDWATRMPELAELGVTVEMIHPSSVDSPSGPRDAVFRS